MFLAKLSYGQTIPNYIIFYKPYSDSIETNLYYDTIIKFNYEIQYANLKNAKIEEDVNRAIKNNDLRIISISGNSYLFPGLEGGYKTEKNGTKVFMHLSDEYKPYLDKHGCKVISGTSDMIYSDRLPLQGIAYDYAKEYNKLLLAKQHF